MSARLFWTFRGGALFHPRGGLFCLIGPFPLQPPRPRCLGLSAVMPYCQRQMFPVTNSQTLLATRSIFCFKRFFFLNIKYASGGLEDEAHFLQCDPEHFFLTYPPPGFIAGEGINAKFSCNEAPDLRASKMREKGLKSGFIGLSSLVTTIL